MYKYKVTVPYIYEFVVEVPTQRTKTPDNSEIDKAIKAAVASSVGKIICRDDDNMVIEEMLE